MNSLAATEHPEYNLEDVFKLSGVPTHTYVKPTEYTRLLVALRTPGRGVVVEGPSKIGKTTSVMKALSEIDRLVGSPITSLTARKAADREFIADLPTKENPGIVLIDDFHRLDYAVRESISDYMKVLADEENTEAKVIIVGINKVGNSLLSIAPDLNGRIEVIRLGVNPNNKIKQLIKQGEDALNVAFDNIDDIVAACGGSFNIAQVICYDACLSKDVMSTCPSITAIDTSFTVVKERVMDRLATTFHKKAEVFATGKRRRREGRAPYLQILRWLSQSEEWTVDLGREMSKYPKLRGSVGQVVEKGHLADHLQNRSSELGNLLHYDVETQVLAVEDPQFFFYIRNLPWNRFAERLGYFDVTFSSTYDFALSFAGPDRDVAELLAATLKEREIQVFYDFDEQAHILAQDVEEYLAPIYASEASYVVPIMGPDYPTRLWTRFESEQFAHRFGENAVIPIFFGSHPPGVFDKYGKVGRFDINRDGPLPEQVEVIAEKLSLRLQQFRLSHTNVDVQAAEDFDLEKFAADEVPHDAENPTA